MTAGGNQGDEALADEELIEENDVFHIDEDDNMA